MKNFVFPLLLSLSISVISTYASAQGQSRLNPSNNMGTVNKLGVCRGTSGDESIFPTSDAASYFTELLHQDFVFDANADGRLRMDIAIRIIEQPKHGKLIRLSPDTNDLTRYELKYMPDENYEGFDNFVIQTSAGGKTVYIYYTLSVVLPGETTTAGEWACPKGSFWKISANHNTSAILSNDQLADRISTAFAPTLAIRSSL